MGRLCVVLALPLVVLLTAAAVPSRPGEGAPALAFLGPYAVGVRTVTVGRRDQADPLASRTAGHLVRADRTLTVSIWYPARPGGAPGMYRAALVSEPPRPPTAFTIPALAVRNARPAGGGYPVVVVSHGYGNDPVMMSWLTENLASKGYVVVAISHRDPPITDLAKVPAALLQRPLDLAAVIGDLRSGGLGGLIDPRRIALVGYSMGGAGVLTSAGARLDPASPALKGFPAALTERLGAADLSGGDIKAVVAIAPAGGAPWEAWGRGIEGLKAPLLVIGGDADRTVGFTKGPAALFAAAIHSDRYMLVFREAGHSIGVDPAPPEMRSNLWDLDWFEDPVWRKDRVNAISLHFITAFLDLRLKGDASRASYLEAPDPVSDDGGWTGPDTPYAAVSQGGANPTWKGFVRNHQTGLVLRHLAATP